MRFFKKKPEGPSNIEIRDTFSGQPGTIWEYEPRCDWRFNQDSAFYLDCAPHAAPKAPETYRCEYCGAPKLRSTCVYCGSR